MNFFDYSDPDIKCRLIMENDLAFSFLTNIPIVIGHSIICPKRNIATIDELQDKELMAILDIRKRLKKVLIKTFAAQGFNYALNEGKAGNQTVNHLHIHMLPRKEGDTGVMGYDPRKFLYRPGPREETSLDELVIVANLIKENIE